MLKAKISIQRLEYRMQKKNKKTHTLTHNEKKYKYIDLCCIQNVQIENMGTVMGTYVGSSTVCTIAGCVTVVPTVRQLEGSSLESELSEGSQFRNCEFFITHQ